MIEGNDVPVRVNQDELVEGVADVAGVGIGDLIVYVGDFHISLTKGNQHIGLMIQPVIAAVHLVACEDIENAVRLSTSQRAGVEGHSCIGAGDNSLTCEIPSLVVLADLDNLCVVALEGVDLAGDYEILVDACEETAPKVSDVTFKAL